MTHSKSRLFQSMGSDLLAGFSVFLIALPLSVGIAIASGAPPAAGLLAAIIGGIFGSFLGGSYLTINGPAAGLIVIVLGSIQTLGNGDARLGFQRTLAAAIFAGLLQVVFGLLRIGIWGLAVPGSVIHGMLTAIGIIIMAKQFHIGLGVIPESKEPIGLLQEIPHSISNLNPEVALITALGLIIILSYKLTKGQWTKYLPAPLLVVLSGVYLGHLFDFEHPHLVSSHFLSLEVGPRLLLALPKNIAQALVFPDFRDMLSLAFITRVITIALVASIESLLSAAAVDRMDPKKRSSNLDRELISKGICNILCGCVGGLPIIAEMVRSKANISNGAQTAKANFFHGAFILLFLLFFPELLQWIPLAALAAILMNVGYALAHPSQFLHTAKIGKEHFLAFLATLFVTLSSDLLIGVACGLLVELIFNFMRGATLKSLFVPHISQEQERAAIRLKVVSPLTFTNYVRFKEILDRNNTTDDLFLDLSEAPMIDHTTMDHLRRFESECEARGRNMKVTLSEHHTALSSHPLAARQKLSKAPLNA